MPLFSSRLSSNSIISYGFFLFLFLLSFGLSFAFWTFKNISVAGAPPVVAGQPLPTPRPPSPITNILLLGYGGLNHDGGLLTDTIILVRLDKVSQTAHLVSIPRDLWVSFPVNGDKLHPDKINAAFAIGSDDKNYPHKLPRYTGGINGGGQLAKYAVAEVIGEPIDYFVSLDFAGFKNAIDSLGGVDVRVQTTFDDYWYPLEGKAEDTCDQPEELVAATATMSGEEAKEFFHCRFEHLHFDRGETHMDGQTALKYVRSRHSAQDGNDFGRSQRQKNLILAVKDKLLSVSSLPRLVPFINTLSQYLKTDLDLTQTAKLSSQALEYKDFQVNSVTISLDNVLTEGRNSLGQYILHPKEGIDQWDQLHSWLQSQYAQTATASAQPSQ